MIDGVNIDAAEYLTTDMENWEMLTNRFRAGAVSACKMGLFRLCGYTRLR